MDASRATEPSSHAPPSTLAVEYSVEAPTFILTPNSSSFRIIKKLSKDDGGNVFLCLPRRLDPPLNVWTGIEDDYSDLHDSVRRDFVKVNRFKRQTRLLEHRSSQMKLFRLLHYDDISALDDGHTAMLPQILVVKMHRDPLKVQGEFDIINFLHKNDEEADLHIGSSIARYQFTGIADSTWLCLKPILGRTLAQYGASTNGIPAWFIYHIFLGLVDALEFIHAKSIVHNDINPTNIMINIYPSETYYRYRGYPDIQLIDFSEAKIIEEDEGDIASSNMGIDVQGLLRTMMAVTRNMSEMAPFFDRASVRDPLMSWHSEMQQKLANTPVASLSLVDVKENWVLDAEERRNRGPAEMPRPILHRLHCELTTDQELDRAVN